MEGGKNVTENETDSESEEQSKLEDYVTIKKYYCDYCYQIRWISRQPVTIVNIMDEAVCILWL